MTLELRTFATPAELAEYLQREADKAAAAVGVHLRQLQEIKAQAEKDRRAKEVVYKLLGRKSTGDDTIRGQEAKLDVVGLLINPYPEQLQTLIEQLLESQQTKLNAIEKVSKSIEPLFQDELGSVSVSVITSNGVPVKFCISTEASGGIDRLTREVTVKGEAEKVARPIPAR